MSAMAPPRGGLPEAAAAVADPAQAAQEVTELVKASLQDAWREGNSHQEVLDALADLIDVHLDVLGSGAATEAEEAHEAALAACLKLARNLCMGRRAVQEHWRRRGVVEKLAPRLRADLARAAGERSLPWRDAVPSFLANLVAGHAELRVHVMMALFPYGLASAFALCWHRPHLAFVLAQNLFAPGEANVGTRFPSLQQLLETPEGHVVIHLMLSLLRGEGGPAEEETPAEVLAREWATIFFHSLWSQGGFPHVYRGIRRMQADTLHVFFCQAALPAGVSPDVAMLALARLVPRLCCHGEAVGLLWHTLHGLLIGPGAGPDGEGCRGDDKPSAGRELARVLLSDEAFVCLASEEMADACSQVALRWKLPWRPEAASEEACAALGVDAAHVDVPALAAAAAEEALVGPAAAEDDGAGREGAAEGAAEAESGLWSRGAGGPFEELMQAAMALSVVPRDAVPFPPRLAAALLSANIALIDALHRVRFGDVARGEAPKKEPSKEAQEASKACLLIDQVRLCGNVLYSNPPAQAFARLTTGLKALLSHCYSDPEVPMLREVGVFAVRNATVGCRENQQAVADLLAERKAAASAAGPGAGLQPPLMAEFGLEV